MLRTTCSLLMRKVRTMWRTAFCARLRITRAVRSCKDSHTKEELCNVALTNHFALDVIFSLSSLNLNLT